MLRRFFDYIAEGVDGLERLLGGTPGTAIRINASRSIGYSDLRDVLDRINNEATAYLSRDSRGVRPEPQYGRAYKQLAGLDRRSRDAAAEKLARPFDILSNSSWNETNRHTVMLESSGLGNELRDALSGETDLQVILEAFEKMAEDMEKNGDPFTEGLGHYIESVSTHRL